MSNWNAGAERIKGYKAHEIAGEHFSKFYTEEDRGAGMPTASPETARRTDKYEAEEVAGSQKRREAFGLGCDRRTLQ